MEVEVTFTNLWLAGFMEVQSCTKKGNSGYSSFDEEKFQTINTSISSTNNSTAQLKKSIV
jgi:hypothetical protein